MKHTQDGKMFTIEDAPLSSSEERLRRIEDTLKISEVMSYYFFCCDNFDPLGMASCFSEDAALSWGPDWEIVRGRAAIYAHLRDIVGGPAAQAHHGGNQQLWFCSPGQAILYCYVLCWKRYHGQRPDYTCRARYETQMIRESDGEWRISSLRFIVSGEDNGGERLGEYLDRPWPPQPIPER